MNSKNYIKIKDSLKRVDDKIAFLEEMKKEAYENRQKICDECSHDFVLIYNQTTERNDDPEWCILKHARCLVCGEYIRLSKNNINWNTDEKLKSEHIINATGFTSEFSQNLYQGDDNILYIAAKREFDKMVDVDTGDLTYEDYIPKITAGLLSADAVVIKKENVRKDSYANNESHVKSKNNK